MTAAHDLFPDSPRFIYAKAPLTDVICQLRFPPILRIESDPPADFQDRIRAIFPLLERGAQHVGLAQGLPPEILKMIGSATGGTHYIFRTEDQTFSLTLAPDWLALSTKKYDRWEAFRKLLIPPLEALVDFYKPAFFTRIGLRYQNAINRAALGLKAHPWVDLLIPSILGALVEPQFEANVIEVRKTIRANFPDRTGGVFVQHGFGGDSGRDRNTYLLDFDFYTEKTEVDNAVAILDDFHTRAGRAFRWCIRPVLHERLEPLDRSSGHARTAHRRRRPTR
jgi:uncharacterized protein (TIGR04255 family)